MWGALLATPDGKSYPFCSYNSGPTFRNRVEGTRLGTLRCGDSLTP